MPAPSTETTTTTLRERLRRGTAPMHARLDAAPVARELLRDGLTGERYARILQRYRRAHAVLEPRLERLAGMRPHAPSAFGLPAFLPRLPALERDLAALAAAGVVPPGADRPAVADAAPSAPVGPPSPSPAGTLSSGGAPVRYLGLRYVLDGATRGAHGIARRLDATLPALRELGAFAYWAVQHRAAHDWPTLAERLSVSVTDACAAEAVHEADEAFAVFQRAFSDDAEDVL